MAIDSFREAAKSDIDAIALLVNAAYRPGTEVIIDSKAWTHESDLVEDDRTTPRQVGELIGKPDAAVLLGLHGNEIIACVRIEKEGTICHIGMLAVRPALQSAGTGKQMLAQAEHYAARHFRAERFRMIVLSDRSELIAFYERRGYRKTGDSAAYPHAAGVGRPKRNNLRIEVMEKSASG